MNLAILKLSDFSNRALSILANVFGDSEARVILSNRAVASLTVALDSRTVVLNPDQTGLYDLALAAQLLTYRRLRLEGPTDERRRDRWLTLKAHRKLVPAAQLELLRRFPGIERLQGRFVSGQHLEGLKLVVKTVEWEPLKRGHGTMSKRQPHAVSEYQNMLHEITIPELEVTGAEDDFQWLVDSIAAGEIPMQTLPGIDDLPFVRIPLRISSSERFPLAEEWEENISSPDLKELITSLMRCHRNKSIVRQERLRSGRHTQAGVHIDANRLVEAVIRNRVGLPSPIFRNRNSLIEPVFDP